LNHKLAAVFIVLVLALPIFAVPARADASSILVYVANGVIVDNFGGVAINTAVTVYNNGTADAGNLTVGVTYNGIPASLIQNYTSSVSVTGVTTGATSTTYSLLLVNMSAGAFSQATLTLRLKGAVKNPSSGRFSLSFPTFPDVSAAGASLANASSTLVLPLGASLLDNITSLGFLPQGTLPPSFTQLFQNGTVPQSTFLTVNFTQPSIVYSEAGNVTVDNFGWTNVDTSLIVTNLGNSATGPLPASMTFFDVFPPITENFFSTLPVTSSYTADNTIYTFTIPDVPAGQNYTMSLHLRAYGAIGEFSPGTYTYNLTNFPVVQIPNAVLYNATSLISLPLATTVGSNMQSFGFATQTTNYPSYLQGFYNNTAPLPALILVNFTTSSTANFGLYEISSLERTLSLAADGSVLVTDHLLIFNHDTQDLSYINLTVPAFGSFNLLEGLVNGGVVDLSTGLLSLKAPISARSEQNVVLQYKLPASAVNDAGGTLTLTIGSGALVYRNVVRSYTVDTNFPSGTVTQATPSTSFANVTVLPAVTITAKVPFGWNLYTITPVVAALLIAAVFIFFLYRQPGVEEFEEEGTSVMQDKAAVVSALLEQYKLRGEGFSSFDDFSAKRKALEEDKNRVSVRLQDFRARSARDRAQKAFYDKMAVEDARLEQLYREGKQALEEKLAGRMPLKDFSTKLTRLRESARPADLLKKAEKKAEQKAAPAK
jgi:hypothetical protein